MPDSHLPNSHISMKDTVPLAEVNQSSGDTEPLTFDIAATIATTEWQDFRIDIPAMPKASFKLLALEVRKADDATNEEPSLVSARITHLAETRYEMLIDEAPISKEISLLSLPAELEQHVRGVFPETVGQEAVLQLKANRSNEVAVSMKLQCVVQVVKNATLN